jgi:hypothetical protein
MELNKLIFAIVVLFLSTCVIRVAVQLPDASDFERARDEILRHVKLGLKYDDTLCEKIGEGMDKIACRLKNVPSVGFLVCKELKIDDESCREMIEKEVRNLVKLQDMFQIKTVEVDKLPIHNVKCGKTDDVTCSGFLEEWIDEDKGVFKHIRNTINNGRFKNLYFVLRVQIL